MVLSASLSPPEVLFFKASSSLFASRRRSWRRLLVSSNFLRVLEAAESVASTLAALAASARALSSDSVNTSTRDSRKRRSSESCAIVFVYSLLSFTSSLGVRDSGLISATFDNCSIIWRQ